MPIRPVGPLFDLAFASGSYSVNMASASETERAAPRPASLVALSLAALGLTGLVAKVLIDGGRTADACGTSMTVLIDRLVVATAAFSILAVIVGVFAVASRRGGKGIAMRAISCGALIATLVLVPEGLGSYTCGVGTP